MEQKASDYSLPLVFERPLDIMADELSWSIFTLEVDRRPVMTFASRRHADAEAICMNDRIRTMLQSVRSEGKPVCDNLSIFRVRLARSNERAAYDERANAALSGAQFPIVFLVELDVLPAGDSLPEPEV